MLIFRAVSVDELRTLAEGERLSGDAYAVTPSFLDAFGLGPGDDEDAERTALYLAALAALVRHGRRLVVVAEASAHDTGDEYGVVGLEHLGFSQVTALFADEESAWPLVEAARGAVAQLSVEDAWDHPAHGVLLSDADLLWYGPEEWTSLVGG